METVIIIYIGELAAMPLRSVDRVQLVAGIPGK